MDIYKKFKPDTPEKKLVVVGRIATGVVVILGILWIPFMKLISGELYHYLQSVQSYIAPPIAAVFLLGLFWKRINASGAMSALIGGFVLGMARLVLELIKGSLSGFLHWYADVSFLHFAIYLFLLCIAILVLVSMFTAPPSYQKIAGLTYSTTVAEDKAASRASWNYKDVLLSIGVVVIIVLILLLFSPVVFAS
jgi:SSS family solute:Na+ symporter